MMERTPRVILYEINEVPWRVLDHYADRNPQSAFARIRSEGNCLTTVTQDVGELHPWSTWPTMHRGVFNTDHGITFINQQIDDKFTPIWEALSRCGVRTGVFGSLQSYGSFPHDPSKYDFYVPDTFAPSAKTYPRELEAFQRLNLRMTARDGAGAKKGIPLDRQLISDLAKMLRTGLSLDSVLSLTRQLARESLNKDYATRRSVLQAPVAFDFFVSAYRKHLPQFATFFSNHVAGMMHRYWHHTFPEDFPSPPQKNDAVRRSNVTFAMDIADQQLEVLIDLCRKNDATLVVASSMGQEAIDRGAYHGELRIVDAEKFVAALGFDEPWTANLAMQPDFAFSLESDDARARFQEMVSTLRAADGSALFSFKQAGATLNCNLNKCAETCRTRRVRVSRDSGEGFLSLDDLGIEVLERDQGTGYHQPRGVLLFHGRRVNHNESRREIPSIALYPTLLSWYKAPIPEYCMAPLTQIIRN